MSYIYGWVRNLVCFYILLTVVLHLLPRENYQKYVRFFAGILLTILVASPILSLIGNEETLRTKISQAGFFQDMDNLKQDTEYLEDTQKQVYLREYEQAVGMDVSRMAEEKQLVAEQVEVHLSEDYQVESIEMTVTLGEDDSVFVQKASFPDDSREYPGVYELKQELMEFYRLKEEQITIGVV